MIYRILFVVGRIWLSRPVGIIRTGRISAWTCLVVSKVRLVSPYLEQNYYIEERRRA